MMRSVGMRKRVNVGVIMDGRVIKKVLRGFRSTLKS